MASRPVQRRAPARSDPPLFYVTEPGPGDGVAKIVWTAFVASVVFHVVLAFSTGMVKVAPLPFLNFPVKEEMTQTQPFEVQDVPVDKSERPNNPQAPPAPLPPQNSIQKAEDTQDNTKLDSDGSTIDRALLATRPQIDIPAPTDPNVAMSKELSAATAFTPADEAKIETEIARLPVGPTSSENLPAFVPAPDAFAKRSGVASSPDPGGRGGLKSTTPGAGEKIPSFDEVTTSFKAPVPVVDPKLPEPVLLYLPSDVLFDYGSSRLREEAFPLLQQTASMIGQYSRAKIQISGHTDSFGTDNFNQRLSEARAQVVEDFLKKALPQPVYTFNVSGYGKSKPIVSPTLSKEEQQRNRRVEVVIQAIPQ
ncbi:MAG: OmpA family protein [Candidatus Methylacidiphilales bacterium]|nr:OmpA family protein [Candidatus Methylacidiphilales bacterium]